MNKGTATPHILLRNMEEFKIPESKGLHSDPDYLGCAFTLRLQ